MAGAGAPQSKESVMIELGHFQKIRKKRTAEKQSDLVT
jgi:hypothetical protein